MIMLGSDSGCKFKGLVLQNHFILISTFFESFLMNQQLGLRALAFSILCLREG
jgi:hypothetical protein